jgi:hypothetical protein
MEQTQAFSQTQLGALSGDKLEAFLTAYASPLILDLDGDGVSTIAATEGVLFDVSGDGGRVRTGWVSPRDGFLALDRNQDGIVNNGAELFGTATQLADGSMARDGFQALSEFDIDGDGAITNADSVWQDMKVWVDVNQDGVSDAGELHRLDDLGISRLNLASSESPDWDNGNIIGLVSSYQTTDGVEHEMADVWFANDQSEPSESPEDKENVTLSAKVTELAQAIGSFEALDQNQILSTPIPEVDQSAVSIDLDLSANVSDMVDVLKSFNSKLTVSDGVVTTSIDTKLIKPDDQGILASGK